MIRIDRWALDYDEKKKIQAVVDIPCSGVNCDGCPLKAKDVCIRALADYILQKEDEK